jgi:Cys-rich protein (TIGR01571 family)
MAQPVDSKPVASLQETPAEAPPSYTETPASVIGDGNAFSHTPSMKYSAGLSQPYFPRSESRSWAFGFFSCFRDPRATLKAIFCPCVSYGQTHHRLHSPNTEAPVFSTPCLGYCLAATCAPGAESIFGLLNRNEIRSRLVIDQTSPESSICLSDGQPSSTTMCESLPRAAGFADDAMRHIFCGCCALVQEDREVRLWEESCADEECQAIRRNKSSELAAGVENQPLLANEN